MWHSPDTEGGKPCQEAHLQCQSPPGPGSGQVPSHKSAGWQGQDCTSVTGLFLGTARPMSPTYPDRRAHAHLETTLQQYLLGPTGWRTQTALWEGISCHRVFRVEGILVTICTQPFLRPRKVESLSGMQVRGHVASRCPHPDTQVTSEIMEKQGN